jgi:hypothetical protein
MVGGDGHDGWKSRRTVSVLGRSLPGNLQGALGVDAARWHYRDSESPSI